MHTFNVVVELPTDCICSFLSPAESDVPVPVLSQSTDSVVLNFVVVLNFPNRELKQRRRRRLQKRHLKSEFVLL